MNDDDRIDFGNMIADVYAFYRRGRETGEVSTFDLEVWWMAMKPFDLAAIRDALGRHTLNPDTGQFRPMPADVVKMLAGSTLDSALVALAKVERAMSSAGAYRTVVFDDPVIHRVVDEMGGWPTLCASKDWTFRRKEFENRYRGYKIASRVPEYPPALIGIADGENSSKGLGSTQENLVMIGSPETCRLVLSGGSETPRIALTHVGRGLGGAMLALEKKP